MKRIAFPLILAFMMVWAIPAHALVDVNVGYGTSFKLDGVLQWQTYGYWGEDLESMYMDDGWTFRIPRLRLIMTGQLVNENISYFVQLDPTNGLNDTADGAWPTNPPTSTLLDVQINFAGLIPNTVVSFGRFLPAWSYFMPRNKADLYLVDLPEVTKMFGMWRQTGIQTTTSTDMVDFYFGIFNGRQHIFSGSDAPYNFLTSDNWTDNNKYKDIFAKAVFKWEGFFLAPSFWYGWPNASTSDETFYILGGELGYVKDGLTVVGEIQTLHYDEDGTDYDSMGAYIHLGYFFLEKWEGMFRWDWLDPTDEGSKDDDENNYFTVGVNYFPDVPVHAKVTLQYQYNDFGDDFSGAKTVSFDSGEVHEAWLQLSLYF